MTDLDSDQLFWYRLAVSSLLIKEVNTQRLEKKMAHKTEFPIDNIDDSPVFRTKYAAEIWKIMSRYPSIRNTTLIALRDAEAYNFDLISSIIDKDDSKRFSNADRFTRLKKVRLLAHTYHVVWYASKMEKEAKGLMPALLLLALLHDFGKSPKISALYASKSYKSHEEISSSYAESILTSSKEYSEEFTSVIKMIILTHHESPTNAPLYLLLNAADHKARILESGSS
jgi:HD-GYP domain-containing protein (c-di-GMP phosphodiesterase class II)